jgi:hypothetical protein
MFLDRSDAAIGSDDRKILVDQTGIEPVTS